MDKHDHLQEQIDHLRVALRFAYEQLGVLYRMSSTPAPERLEKVTATLDGREKR